MTKILYIAIDGDDVGKRLEYYIVTNQVNQLSEYFQVYQEAMSWIEEELIQTLNATVIINGGDSLLAFCENDIQASEILEALRAKFSFRTNATLSIGLGENPRRAYFALKLAKASGKNRIEVFEEC
jgi:GTP cyclohydrolase III